MRDITETYNFELQLEYEAN